MISFKNKSREEKGLPTLSAMLLWVWLSALFSPAFAAEPEAPAGHLDSAALAAIFELAQLVDCRSRLEYDVLHMKNAVHVPVATMVRDDLERLRIKDSARPIVFYGNGGDCPEGLVAFLKAGRWGYKNIFVYRPGLFIWAKERPEKVLFFGEVPDTNAQQQLFKAEHSLEHTLSPRQFVEMARQPGSLVIDIRDAVERDQFMISLPNMQHYPIDHLVKLIRSGSRKVMGKKMFIVDSCGGRSPWLQYIFAEKGIAYSLLRGGVKGWRQAGLDSLGNSKQVVNQ